VAASAACTKAGKLEVQSRDIYAPTLTLPSHASLKEEPGAAGFRKQPVALVTVAAGLVMAGEPLQSEEV
tara:strand:- start:1324 stop:1530 length:207 start_codon:yes stop_codon:yes gene_type:complete